MRASRLLFGGFIVAVYVYLLAPVIVVVVTSFNKTALNAFPPQGLSFRWYLEFFNNPTFVNAFFNISLKIAIAVAFIATFLSLLATIAISRYRFRFSSLIQTFLLSPLMIPHMLVGIALLLFFSKVFIGGSLRLIIGHIIISMPIAVRAIYSSMAGLNPAYEEAACTLGANRWQTFFLVTLRLTFSGIMAAFIFSFIISFTDVNVALFLTGPGTTTLPIEIFTFLMWDSNPMIAAITTIQVFIIIAFSYILEKLVGLSSVMQH
jgi:putative spermidine/putrescine transport system permease protein